jgi:hypothetical protein
MMQQHLDALSLGAVRHYYSQYNLELQHRSQHDSVALSPAWLDLYITP